MSSRYWSFITAIAGLAFVASALLLLVRDLSAVDSAYRHAATDAAIKYERDAHANVKERCLTPTGLGEPDCTAKADEAAREGQRKEHDLAAQNITAWWTKVMGIAALIGMALSAVGVWLVKTTFDETRRANEIAKLSVFQQLRAYLTMGAAVEEVSRFGDGESRFIGVRLTIINSGATPATDITITYNKFVDPENIETVVKPMPDIGGQSNGSIVVPFYCFKPFIGIRPKFISGEIEFVPVIPNHFNKLEPIVTKFSVEAMKAEYEKTLKVDIVALPAKTNF